MSYNLTIEIKEYKTMTLNYKELNNVTLYYLSGGGKFIYKKNVNTNQMVPVGECKLREDGVTIIGMFYPENKTFNSCNFLNLYTPEFYIHNEEREYISWSEFYHYDEGYSEVLTIEYIDKWINQIEFDNCVLGYMLGTGVGPHNAMIWLYDQFIDNEMFRRQSEEAKNAASLKTVYSNIFEKLYSEP